MTETTGEIEERAAPSAPDIVIVTGMSGAGRSTAAKSLEDLGWFVVDNLPPALLPTMLDLADRASLAGIAAIVDVRSRAFSTDLKSAISSLGARGVSPQVLFLEASDSALVRRFENVRRPHPMQGPGTILDGIAAERRVLREVRDDSDIVLDTSSLNVHQLRARMHGYFGGDSATGLRLNIISFGYKYGLPVDADLVADCRFLPNPHWVAELRAMSGLDAPVRDYVLGQPAAKAFVDAYLSVLDVSLPGFEREGKRHVTLAVGCTGGKHRSVAVAQELAARLSGRDVAVSHRDLGRE
jgi:RNase adapter protein RapZ